MSTGSRAIISQPRTCVLVMGMHRSGTSALTGVLNQLGCELPRNLMPVSKSNAKGFFEGTAIRDFNDEILASGGSSWDDFTPFNPAWLNSPQSRQFIERSGQLLDEELGDSRLFALKDPRTCRLFPFWKIALEEFGCEIAPILIVRNPLEVSGSLKRKRNMSEPLSQMIWLRHVLDAEKHTRGMTRLHTSYEQLMRGWELMASAAEKKLGVVWPKPIANIEFEVARFLSQNLRHFHEDQSGGLDRPTLGPWLRDAYDIFDRWARQGEDSTDYARLDQIGAEFDMASLSFARLVRAERDGSIEVKVEVASLKEQLSDSDARRRAIKEQYLAGTAAQEDLQQQVQDLNAKLERQAETARGLQAERNQLESAFLLEQTRLEDQLQSQRLQSEAELQRERGALEQAFQLERSAFQAQLKDLADELQEQRRKTTLLEAEVFKRTEALEGAEGRIAQTESALRQRQAEAEEAWKAANAANDELAQTRKTLDSAEAAHRETRLQLTESEASLEKRQKDLEAGREALRAAEKEIETRFRELAVLSRIASEHEARAAELQAEQKTLKAKLYAEREHRGALERDLHRLGKSLSWQITRPLRAIGRAWKKLVGRQRG